MADTVEGIETDPELIKLLSELPESVDKSRPGGIAPAQTELAPVSVPPVIPKVPVPTAAPASDEDDEIKKILSSFAELKDEIFRNYKGDRGQVEIAIQAFKKAIDDGKATQAVIEAYVQALRIKSDINSNAIRMLDSTARMLAAGKGTSVFIQNSGISAQQLEVILSSPLYPDEQQRTQAGK
jgi:hypothetical protein